MECFSRKMFVATMKSKSSADVLHCFTDIHHYIGKSPHTIDIDKGLEFNSSIFKNYCKEHKIKLIFPKVSLKRL